MLMVKLKWVVFEYMVLQKIKNYGRIGDSNYYLLNKISIIYIISLAIVNYQMLKYKLFISVLKKIWTFHACYDGTSIFKLFLNQVFTQIRTFNLYNKL